MAPSPVGAPSDPFLAFCEGLCDDVYGGLTNVTCVMTEARRAGVVTESCHSGSCSTIRGIRAVAELMLPLPAHARLEGDSYMQAQVIQRTIERMIVLAGGHVV